MADELKESIEFDINQISEPTDLREVIDNLMVNPNLSPLNYFNDFSEESSDLDTTNADEGDHNIVELPSGDKLVTISTHAMHHHLEKDPQKAAQILVSKATRKMVCFGATPIAVSTLLYHIDFGDPNGNYIASGVRLGIEEAAEAFGIKVLDRKIRFDSFDDNAKQSPTVIISMIGVVPVEKGKVKSMTNSLKNKGNNIFMIGRSSNDIGTSDYLEFYHGVKNSPLPEVDIKFEAKLHSIIKGLINEKLIDSASPVGKGGLFFTLLRGGWQNELGFDITTDAEHREDAFLFGEAMGRIVVGVNPGLEDEFVDYMFDSKIPFFTLGHVTKGEIRIDDEKYGYVDKMSDSI